MTMSKTASQENKNTEQTLIRSLWMFTLFWLPFTVLLSIRVMASPEQAWLAAERTRLWIQIGYVTIAALLLHRLRLETRLVKVGVPIVILLLSIGSVATLFVPFSVGEGTDLRLLVQFSTSITRSHIIWIVAITTIGWLYNARYAVIYSIVMGFFVSISILQVEGLQIQAVAEHVINTLFLMAGFALIGYLVAQLSLSEKQRRAELVESNKHLANYASTMEQLTISRERNRLARELHDTLAHTLSGLTVQMETIRRYWDIDKGTAKQLFEQSATLARDGLDETRRALTALRASPLEEMGLIMALEQLAKSAKTRANLQLRLSLPTHPLSLAPEIEQAIYRIAQESFNNVVRHAQASTLTVRLQNGNATQLVIADNGRGFLAEDASSSTRFGIVGMHERAKLVGGTLTIDSHPDNGTTVKLSL